MEQRRAGLKRDGRNAKQREIKRAGLKPGLYKCKQDYFQWGFQFVGTELVFIQSMVCDPDRG